MTSGFRAAHVRDRHWGLAAKACLDALGGVRPGDNVGFVYVTRELAGALSSILTLLRETTGIACWTGAAGFGIYAPGAAVRDGPAVALMIGALPEGAARAFAFDGGTGFRRQHGAWLDGHPAGTAIVHGVPCVRSEGLVAQLAEAMGGYLVGGFSAAADEDRGLEAGLAGLLLGAPVAVVAGLAQGCAPIGPALRVTRAMGSVVMELDGRKPLEVLRQQAGALIGPDLQQVAGHIHAGLPVAGSDTGAFAVRSLSGIDRRRGWIAVEAALSPGDPLMFVRRGEAAATAGFERMLDSLARRLRTSDQRPLAGIFVSCVGRQAEPAAELAAIEERLGRFPVVGFAAGGEICHDRIHTYSGVLAILMGGAE